MSRVAANVRLTRLRQVTVTQREFEIGLLQHLQRKIYLSTACAAGDHLKCRLVDKYRSMVCCCPDCGHDQPIGENPLLTGPLLHPVDRAEEQLPGYIYRDGLGRRYDLIKLATDLVLLARADPPERKVLQAADKIALFFAPRFG